MMWPDIAMFVWTVKLWNDVSNIAMFVWSVKLWKMCQTLQCLFGL